MPMPAKLPTYQQGGLVSGPGADYSALWRRQAEANNRSWDAVNQQAAPAQQPHIKIAPPAAMSANAQKVLAQARGMPSRNWGEAISKLGNVWASKRAGERQAEALAQAATELQGRRQGWGAQLAGGMSQRELAASDPRFIEDAKYQAFLKGTAPAPDPEQWDTVQDPYGRGGAAQKSSTTGLFKNYQGPLSTPTAPQRRIVKGPDNLNYYEDDKSRVLPGVSAPTPEPVATGPSMPDQLKMVRQLSDNWQKTVRQMQGLLDSRDRMNIGLKLARSGDMLAGSQAVLISFNKFLDPTSVVRESEYARSATGQSALSTLKGMADKLARGGAGVTESELESYARFGQQVVQRALESTVAPERKRIERLVEFAGVDPQLIFTGRFASDASPEGAPQASQGGVATAPPAPMAEAPSSLLSQAQAAPVATGQPASKGPAPDQARIKVYAELPPAALERQARAISANPDNYSAAEKAAASVAWQRAFGGGQ